MGITQHITGVDNVKSLANLAMLSGQIGKESAGVNPFGVRTMFKGPVTWEVSQMSIRLSGCYGWTDRRKV